MTGRHPKDKEKGAKSTEKLKKENEREEK